MSRADRFTPETKKFNYYSDFTTNMDFHPLTGDIARVTNEEAVKQSIRQLILTGLTERPYEPSVGSKLATILFDPIDSQTTSLIESTIRNVIRNNEQRANIIEVVVVPDDNNNQYRVSVVFSVINTQNEVTLNLILKRVR